MRLRRGEHGSVVAGKQWRQRWGLKKGRVEVHSDNARWLWRLRGLVAMVVGLWWWLAVMVSEDFFAVGYSRVVALGD